MKMRGILLILLLGTVSATPRLLQNRIVGGSVTTINNYPHIVSLLVTWDLVQFDQNCGGSILNQRNILTAGHCFDWENNPSKWRIRVGSSFAHSGGTVHNIGQITIHPDYDQPTFKNDIAVMRTSSYIAYIDNIVQPGTIAGVNHNLGDDEIVWAVGWGVTEYGIESEQLRHVQIWTINQNICNERFRGMITEGMLCTGWLNIGGRDQCTGDSGGPVYHNGVIVGVCSFGSPDCGSAIYPGVNARVSHFTPWIVATAV